MDKGAWQVTVHRVLKSQTRLKRLSTHTVLKTGARAHAPAPSSLWSSQLANREPPRSFKILSSAFQAAVITN